MIVVLNLVESGKKKVRKGQTVRKVTEHQTGGGERFYIVDVSDSETGVNWDEVAAFIGRHSARVITDRTLYLPDDSILKRFTNEKFINILLFNTMSMIFKELYMSGFRTKCYINDRDGKYSYLLPCIAGYSGETVVVTRNDYRYFPQIQSVYGEFGAGVTVTAGRCEPEMHSFIIDADGTYPYNGKGILFSAHSGISPCRVEGFDDIRKMCPAFIDDNDFLGAMYEMNREKRLSHAFCATMCSDAEEKTVHEIIQELKIRISASPDRRKSIIFYV